LSHHKGEQMKKEILILIWFCCFGGLCHGQNKRIDSLLQLLITAREDTNKVNTLGTLAKELGYSNPDSSILLSTQALQMAERIKWQLGIVKSHLILGWSFVEKGDNTSALKHFSKSLEICNELEKSGTTPKSQVLRLKSKAIANMGGIYRDQGNYPEAMKIYIASLRIFVEARDKQSMAYTYNNIGIVNGLQSNYPEALKNFFAALRISQETGDKQGMAGTYNNIGAFYHDQGNYPEALHNYFAALKLNEELGNKKWKSFNLGNIGVIYKEQGNFTEALKYFSAGLKIDEELGDKNNIASTYQNLGSLYGDLHNYPEALKNYSAALKIFEELEIGRAHV
jgi:tetratricopeptide (TPR) repeat protein